MNEIGPKQDPAEAHRAEAATTSPRKANPNRPEPEQPRWGNDHPVNIRLSVPLIFGRCYVTIVAGSERRAPERRKAEHKKHRLLKAGNLVAFTALGIICGFAMFFPLKLAMVDHLESAGITFPNNCNP